MMQLRFIQQHLKRKNDLFSLRNLFTFPGAFYRKKGPALFRPSSCTTHPKFMPRGGYIAV